MSLCTFTDLEKSQANNEDFVKVKVIEITPFCIRASEVGKYVFVNYFVGSIHGKEYKAIQISEEGATTLTTRLRFDPTREKIEPAALKLLERTAAWNGIDEQKLKDLLLVNSPWYLD